MPTAAPPLPTPLSFLAGSAVLVTGLLLPIVRTVTRHLLHGVPVKPGSPLDLEDEAEA